MRLSMIRAGVVATVAAIALAGCGGRSVVPSSPTGVAPMVSNGDMSPLALKTCDTSPPQYEWIFKGACDQFPLTSSGGDFSLQTYEDITVTGSIGKNTAKGKVTVAVADAVDKNGDIEKSGGKSFPVYKGKGTTFVYAAANNESTETIKPVSVRGKAVIQYVITDSKGLPGKTCSAAILAHEKTGVKWNPLPSGYPVKGKTVTISLFEAPNGFELPPKTDKTPVYFAVNCYT